MKNNYKKYLLVYLLGLLIIFCISPIIIYFYDSLFKAHPLIRYLIFISSAIGIGSIIIFSYCFYRQICLNILKDEIIFWYFLKPIIIIIVTIFFYLIFLFLLKINFQLKEKIIFYCIIAFIFSIIFTILINIWEAIKEKKQNNKEWKRIKKAWKIIKEKRRQIQENKNKIEKEKERISIKEKIINRISKEKFEKMITEIIDKKPNYILISIEEPEIKIKENTVIKPESETTNHNQANE